MVDNTNKMHTEVRQDKLDPCSKYGMNLIPAKKIKMDHSTHNSEKLHHKDHSINKHAAHGLLHCFTINSVIIANKQKYLCNMHG